MSRRAGVSVFVFLLLAYLVAPCLPAEAVWENGPIETAQNLALSAGAVLCARYCLNDRRNLPEGGTVSYRLWFFALLVFILLLGRELSWGRVFFPAGISPSGPRFPKMRDITPYYRVIHGLIGLWAAAGFAGLLKLTPWKVIFTRIPLPSLPLFALCVCAVLSMAADKGFLDPFTGRHTALVLEECAELSIYFLLFFFVYYYHHRFACLQNASAQNEKDG